MMKSHIIMMLFLLATVNLFALNLGGEVGSSWELIDEDSGIQVYERWVTNSQNLKVKERSGKMTLNCNIDDVLELIADVDQTHLWMCNVESVRQLKAVHDNAWYVHTVLDAPWPFSKQDMVSKYKVERSENKAVVLILKEDKLLPPQTDIDRLDTFNAEWIIEQVKERQVKITFTTKSTQPPKYPSWAQDPVVRKVFFNNLKNFKSVINNS